MWRLPAVDPTTGNASYIERGVGSQHHYVNLRVGDGFDENCDGGDDLCVSSPYAVGGGDPVNGIAGPKYFWARDVFGADPFE